MVTRLVSDPLLPLATCLSRHPPAREAIVHAGQRWSFGALDRRAAQLAAWLGGRGVAPDDLVAFALPNGPEFLALTFAIYACGATPAPLSTKLPKAELDPILATMRPGCFIAEPDLPAPGANDPVEPPHTPHIAASWKACTSGGSTGQPKVIVDGRPAGFTSATEFIAIPRDSRVLVPGPLYHNAPFSAAIFALFRGNTVITMPRFDAEGALRLIDEERASWALMVPTMMHRIMALPREQRASHNLSHWSRVVHTAAPMPAWLKRKWIDWLGADHIWEVYGATEGLVCCWIGGTEWLERPGSVGKPLGGARLRILDEHGADVPQGELGEVFAMPPQGPGTSYRYIGATRRATADGWESVGDAGWLDADGYLYLADRRDDLIISGGVNIWPAEVEAALLTHPDIASCAVYGVPHAELGMAVHATIESVALRDIDALSAFLATRLARTKHPRSITLTQTPVRDDAGKFRKPRIKEVS